MVDDTLLGLILAGALAIIGVSALAPRIGVASPLLLVIFGFLLSRIPGLPTVQIHPEIIFVLVLPPLLYATAVNVPTMDLRRNWGAITGLSVLLVVATSLIFGLVIYLWLPGLDLAAAIAAGAVLSPTGSVATMVSKKVKAPNRLITMLEGEGLLNDATALVVLRSAIAATAATMSFASAFGNFLWLIAWGVICGILTGTAGIWARRIIRLPELTTALTFVIPFAAFLAAETLGASGEVAVVVTGLFTGWAGMRFLEPQDRQYGQYNWLTIATMLEGALFFLMGLELSKVFTDTITGMPPSHHVLLLGLLSGGILLAVRAVFVFPLISILNRAALKSRHQRHHLVRKLPEKVRKLTWAQSAAARLRPADSAALRRIADADYRIREHLGRKEGIALLWSGMRGAVTLAAAQTLPWDFPYRSLLVLFAAVVATGTLLIQGFTLPFVLKHLKLTNYRRYEPSHLKAIRTVLKESSERFLNQPHLLSESGQPYDPEVITEVKEILEHEPTLLFLEGAETTNANEQARDLRIVENSKGPQDWDQLQQFLELRRRVFETQHEALLEVLAIGTHDSEAIARVYDTLDADQMAVELRMEAVDAAH